MTYSREFLELDAELPKASNTSTLSGKSVLKAITKLGDKVSQYATKMEETDAWFEDKTNIIENLDNQLRKLLLATDAMVEFRFVVFPPEGLVSTSTPAQERSLRPDLPAQQEPPSAGQRRGQHQAGRRAPAAGGRGGEGGEGARAAGKGRLLPSL